MSDFVTATPSIVGFTNGHNNGYGYNHGISDKDQMFAVDIEANERTRDLLAAVTLNGAANQLATEKIGAAGILESAKNTAAIQLQASLDTSELRLQAAVLNSETRLENSRVAAAAALAAAQNQAALAAQIAECCCEQKALVLAIDAQRIRDDLAEARLQLIAIRSGGNPVVFAGK